MANYTLLTAEFERKEERDMGNSRSKTPGCHCTSDWWEDVKLCIQTLLCQFLSTCRNSQTHQGTFCFVLPSPFLLLQLFTGKWSFREPTSPRRKYAERQQAYLRRRKVFVSFHTLSWVPLVRLETPVAGAWDWWLKRKGTQWSQTIPKILRLKS